MVATDEKPIRAMLWWTDTNGKQRITLREGDTAQVGRDPGNKVHVASEHVSRRHALLEWREGHFVISDLGSLNGTKVNGTLIEGPTELRDSDVITLYKVDLTFRLTDRNVDLDVGEAEDLKDTFIVPVTAQGDRLIVSSGPQEGRVIPLTVDKAVIGRATARASWDIALQDRSVSRPHAQIEKTSQGYVLTDLGSANGTLVNGDPILEARLLEDGDLILIGETALLFRAK